MESQTAGLVVQTLHVILPYYLFNRQSLRQGYGAQGNGLTDLPPCVL